MQSYQAYQTIDMQQKKIKIQRKIQCQQFK